jgi:creatinine amidohydrolase
MAIHRYGELTWRQIEGLDRNKTVAILPIGSVEQHGHHMPVLTDTNVALEISRRVAERVSEFDWLILPEIAYGYAKASEAFPGTISLDGETLRRITHDVVRGIARQGFDRVLIVSCNYENAEYCIEGATEVFERRGSGKAILMMWWEFISEKMVLDIFGDDWGGWANEHAGMMESSLMVYCRPDTVNLAAVEPPKENATIQRFRVMPHKRRLFPPSGTSFNTEGCTPKRGKELLSAVLSGAQELLVKEFSTPD